MRLREDGAHVGELVQALKDEGRLIKSDVHESW